MSVKLFFWLRSFADPNGNHCRFLAESRRNTIKIPTLSEKGHRRPDKSPITIHHSPFSNEISYWKFQEWKFLIGSLRFQRAIQHDLNRCSAVQHKVFSTRQQDCSGSRGGPDTASNGCAPAPVGDDAAQSSLSGGRPDRCCVMSFARITLNRSLTFSIADAPHTTKRGIDRKCCAVGKDKGL